MAVSARMSWLGSRAVDRLNKSPWVLWLVVFVPLVVLYLCTIQEATYDAANDVRGVTPSAWSLAHLGSPRFPKSIAPSPYWAYWLVDSGPNMTISNRAPGLIWLAMPFYKVAGSAHIFDLGPASVAAALFTAAAMATFALVARRLVSGPTAFVAAIVAGTATTTWAISGRALWPHGPDSLYLMLAIWFVGTGWHLAGGLSFFLAVLTRPITAVSGAVVGLWHGIHTRSLRPTLLIGVPQVAAVGILLWYSNRYWGGGLLRNYSETGSDFGSSLTNFGFSGLRSFSVNVAGTFISPGQGILIQSPFLVLLLPGLRRAWRVAPPWAQSFAIAGVVYMVVQLKTNRFSGGSGFWAYRYALEPLIMCAPLLLLAWREWTSRTAARRGIFAGLAVLSIGLQAIGVLLFRQPYPENASWNIKALDVALYRLPYPLIPAVLLAVCGLSFAMYYWVSRRPVPALAEETEPFLTEPDDDQARVALAVH